MKTALTTAATVAFSIFLLGCASPPQQNGVVANSLTTGQVTLTLKKNETTQTEVLEKFGAPNLVTTSADGLEVWTYQKHATVATSSSSSSFATVILAGVSSHSSGFEQSSRTMTLIIKFAELNGVKRVIDFASRASSF